MNVLFIGDSITEGFDLEHYFPGRNYVNHGISGYSSGDILETIHAEWFKEKPDMVFICIGTNDLARVFNETETLGNIAALIEFAKNHSPSRVKIYLTSLFPTRHNPPRPNPTICSLNSKLHDLANQMGILYFHIHPFFAGESGQLKREFTHDGLHLSEPAYKKWVGLINDILG